MATKHGNKFEPNLTMATKHRNKFEPNLTMATNTWKQIWAQPKYGYKNKACSVASIKQYKKAYKYESLKNK